MKQRTIFELNQIYVRTHRYPTRKVDDYPYGLFTTLEKAEGGMRDIVAKALEEKAEAEKEGEKDYGLATTIGYVIREIALDNTDMGWNGISMHTYTRMGEPNDDFVYTTPDDPTGLLPFYGVPEEKIKFQVGDIVEVVQYKYASLEIVAATPSSTQRYERFRQRWEKDGRLPESGTYWDGTDYCYLTYSLGAGDTHSHPDAPMVFAPTKKIPGKLRRKLYAKLLSMHLAYGHAVPVPLMEKFAQEPGINEEILDDLDKVAERGYMDTLHEHVENDIRILKFTDEQTRRLQEIGKKAEQEWKKEDEINKRRTMKLTIHRGTHQIGGCITEIQHEDYRLFIDMGKPLPGTPAAEPLEVEGLTHGDTTRSALFITHYHDDHIGEILGAQCDVPIYMGKTSLAIYRCGKSYLHNVFRPYGVEHVKAVLRRIETVHTFLPGKCLQIGPFQITPLMIDHSAFDAYMFVIEAGGTRLLYTGDFRGHGFRSKALPKLLAVYAKNIDYVISEGTNVCRSADIESEPSLQYRFIEEFRQSKYNFVLTASTNMDRIFSLYHAAYQAGRIFVCDNYQKQLMDIVASNHGVYTNFYKISEQIFVPKRYRDGNIFCPERLLELMKRKGFCMLIRSNPHFWNFVAKFDGDQDQAIYYSMWEGYLDESSPATLNRSMKEALARYPDFKSMHTSGHCDIRTLEKLFWQVKPKKGIIPIHTEHPERFETLFGQIAPVILLEDGNTYDCC